MDPLTFGAITGGAGILGGYLQNQQTMGAIHDQENFQENMSNTAYQRSSQDMEKAGFNPMMMFGSGAAASTPSGASMPMLSPISTGVTTGLGAMKQAQDMNQQDSTIDNLDADTDNKASTGKLLDLQAASTAQDIKSKATTNQYLNDSLKAQLAKAKAEGDFAQVNQIMGVIQSGTGSAANVGQVIKTFLPGKGTALDDATKAMAPYMKNFKP